ncbi:hypothetical protein [Methylocella sp. CPCC 101449]|uniref:hypothetical protein n=1 Tax=Methylocella sp. CPCC 101449 TaxID=2987531 RepID=UPI00288EFB03|nr:hypothetical protein [Methylocella sp. CPCC 101449]MDT2020555.1 hypothetical protein [Methylocella sp. CPCC 101449]
MPKLSYQAEQLLAAAEILVGAADLETRLLAAFRSMPAPEEADLDAFPDIKKAYAMLIDAATRVRDQPGVDFLQATISSLNDEEAERLARQVLSLLVAVTKIDAQQS